MTSPKTIYLPEAEMHLELATALRVLHLLRKNCPRDVILGNIRSASRKWLIEEDIDEILKLEKEGLIPKTATPVPNPGKRKVTSKSWVHLPVANVLLPYEVVLRTWQLLRQDHVLRDHLILKICDETGVTLEPYWLVEIFNIGQAGLIAVTPTERQKKELEEQCRITNEALIADLETQCARFDKLLVIQERKDEQIREIELLEEQQAVLGRVLDGKQALPWDGYPYFDALTLTSEDEAEEAQTESEASLASDDVEMEVD